MKKLKTATLVTLVLLISWAGMIFALFAAVVILSKGNDRLLVLSLGVVGIVAIILGRLGWEGIMAKRLDGPYQKGRRSRYWLKIKPQTQSQHRPARDWRGAADSGVPGQAQGLPDFHDD